MYKQWIQYFIICYLSIMATIFGVVYVIDPYLHYHEPYFNLTPAYNSAVIEVSLNPGMVQQYDYNAILVGASIVEPLSGNEIERLLLNDEQTLIKIPYSGGTAKNHSIILEQAFKESDIKTVVYGLDTFAFNKENYNDTYSDLPTWLYDYNPLNDCNYIYNLETLVSAIPNMIKMEHVNDEDILSDAYTHQWRDVEFSRIATLSTYSISKPKEMIDPTLYVEYAKNQFNYNLKPILEENLDTRFIFVCLPYSILYWDTSFMRGEYEGELAVKEYLLGELLKYSNVEIYDFQADRDIVMNLENYKDRIHYSPEIGQLVIEKIALGENRVTYENMYDGIVGIRNLYEEILSSYSEFTSLE